jgi:hypothetical protein
MSCAAQCCNSIPDSRLGARDVRGRDRNGQFFPQPLGGGFDIRPCPRIRRSRRRKHEGIGATTIQRCAKPICDRGHDGGIGTEGCRHSHRPACPCHRTGYVDTNVIPTGEKQRHYHGRVMYSAQHGIEIWRKNVDVRDLDLHVREQRPYPVQQLFDDRGALRRPRPVGDADEDGTSRGHEPSIAVAP